MAEIFISYKSERRPAARHLKKVLDCYFRTSGDECVWYDYGLIPGDDFEPRIMAEIAQSSVVIVLWCDMAIESTWVHKEAREARRSGKYLPVRIETCALPAEFAGADTINLAGWDASPRSSVLDRLLVDVGRRIRREPISRLSSLREVEEDWRSYGAPTLAAFALGRSLRDNDGQESHAVDPAKVKVVLGDPPVGITQNLRLHWENAQRGEPISLTKIGYAFGEGEDGLAKDDREAVRLYSLAAQQGHADAQFNLGFMHAYGRGVPKDESEAVRLYKLASDQGNANAQFNLGNMYLDGRGVAKDESQAVRFYLLAAEQGHERAQNNLGNRYMRGQGVAKDEAEAIRLFKLAAQSGNAKAQATLSRLNETW